MMEKLGIVGGGSIRPLGMLKAIQNMLFAGVNQPNFGVSSQKPSYSGSTGSFKQNQRRERKISARRKHKRLSK